MTQTASRTILEAVTCEKKINAAALSYPGVNAHRLLKDCRENSQWVGR